MSKKTIAILSGIGVPVLLFIGSFANNLIRDRQDEPSYLIGSISYPRKPVLVTLDNGAQSQRADSTTGFFRFDKLAKGPHLLRFAYKDFMPQILKVQVNSPGENELPGPIALKVSKSASNSPQPSPTILASLSAVASHSSDGSDPQLNIGPTATNALFGAAPKVAAKEAWVNIGTMEHGVWTSSKIDVGSGYPKAGQSVSPSMVLPLRASPPKPGSGGFVLGKYEGLLLPKDVVTFSDVLKQTKNGAVWARVKVKK